MERNQKQKDSLSIVEYKLINCILDLNINTFLTNEIIKKRKENENYLIKMKKYIETKYKSFTQSIIKLKKEIKESKHNSKIKEILLNFNNISIQKCNKTFNRYIKIHKQYTFINQFKKVILIQSIFRSYIFRKEFYKEKKEKLQKKCIDSIVKIQSFIRQKLSLKHTKILMINNKIVKNYKIKENLIENLFTSYYNIIKFKNSFLTYNLIQKRYEAIAKIQSIYRGKKICEKIQTILKKMKNLYTITYPFKANEVEIKIHVLMNNLTIGKFGELKFTIKTYKFEYNKILKMFLLFIEPNDLESGKYRCQLIVDNIITYDQRYPHIEFCDGECYNLINFKVNNILNGNINEIEQESPSDDIENTNQSLNNGKKKFEIRKESSSFEDLKINLESNVCISRMEYIKKKSLTDLINFE